MKIFRFWGPLSRLCLLLCLLPACAPETDTAAPFKIAVIAPLSGEYEAVGGATHNGVVLAVEEWNQRGGVLGRPIQIVLEDGKCDYQTAREATQRAITTGGARFIIGAVCANESEGVAQVAVKNKALQITHASVNLDLTLDAEGVVRPLVFRVPFADPVQGEAMAQFALTQLNVKKAAILYAENSSYGRNLANAFETTFKAGGGSVVARKTYKSDAEVYFEVLETIRDESPEVLYMPGYATVINRLGQQARTFGLLQVILGSDGWDSPDLNPNNVNNSYFPTHYTPQEPRQEVQTWIQAYEARYIVQPDAIATLAYDATNILLAAIVKADDFAPESVAQAMEKMTFQTVGGPLQFDATHNPRKDIILLKVQNGQVQFATRLETTEADTP
ncbi:MAG TPA: ABC transporter substrate-binding protein [Anaerolineae bacterium]|nr:ABC transporter substrate-binding protein [Anaerolineae bacterium]